MWPKFPQSHSKWLKYIRSCTIVKLMIGEEEIVQGGSTVFLVNRSKNGDADADENGGG